MHDRGVENSSRTRHKSHPFLCSQCLVWVLAHRKIIGKLFASESDKENVDERKEEMGKRKEKTWRLGGREGRGKIDRMWVWARKRRRERE